MAAVSTPITRSSWPITAAVSAKSLTLPSQVYRDGDFSFVGGAGDGGCAHAVLPYELVGLMVKD